MLAHGAWNNLMPNGQQDWERWSMVIIGKNCHLTIHFEPLLRMYFDNIVERRPPCRRCIAYDWMNLWVMTADSLHTPTMNRLSTLNSQFEYWKELPIQHLLDLMHIMKNVCHSLLLHLQGAKNTNSRKDDLEVSNTKHMLWRSIEHGVAPYVMPKIDQIVFFHSM